LEETVVQVWQVSTVLPEVLVVLVQLAVQLVSLSMLEDLKVTILERATQSRIHTQQELLWLLVVMVVMVRLVKRQHMTYQSSLEL
jgi:hypothetical protein